jgi:hypothetical protein
LTDSFKLIFQGQLAKECGEPFQGSWVHPTLDLLAPARHLDEASTFEFLDVVGQGRWRNIEIFAKLPDAQAHRFFGAATGTWRAASGEAAKEGKTMLIPQRLELLGQLFNIISTVRHTSKCEESID